MQVLYNENSINRRSQLHHRPFPYRHGGRGRNQRHSRNGLPRSGCTMCRFVAFAQGGVERALVADTASADNGRHHRTRHQSFATLQLRSAFCIGIHRCHLLVASGSLQYVSCRLCRHAARAHRYPLVGLSAERSGAFAIAGWRSGTAPPGGPFRILPIHSFAIGPIGRSIVHSTGCQ